jgi:hypothetical protein
MVDSASSDDQEIFESSEAFENSVKQLVATVLSDEHGVPYPHFVIPKNKSADASVCWEDGTMILGGMVGPSPSVSGITHELGHLMIAPDEGIGQKSWGLNNPRVSLSWLGVEPLPPEKLGQIKSESRAWAWQYLIEIMAGFRTEGSPIPDHDEATWLADGSKYMNDRKTLLPIVHKTIQDALDVIMTKTPDWRQAIKTRVADVGRIIAENSPLYLTDEFYGNAPVQYPMIARGRRKDISVELIQLPYGWFQVVGKVVDKKEGELFSTDICLTRDIKRAERFLEIACQTNELKARRVHKKAMAFAA